jgi:2-methylcitrate dehydratase PrpD
MELDCPRVAVRDIPSGWQGAAVLIAQTLAEFVRATTAVPETARTAALRAVLDLLGASYAGYRTQGGEAARIAAASAWGAGPAAIWFSPTRLTVPGAAFANASMASMLDLDDGHRAAAGHPGASVIPAVIATSDACNADGRAVLTAIAIGYEVSIRIARARDLVKLDTLVSGRWCGQGAAAAAGWLRGLSSTQIAQAIAISGATAPNMIAVARSRLMGNHVKEGIPWATATGLTATDLAAAGSSGPLDLFDCDPQYEQSALTRDLGDRWLIEGLYFKPYGCCRWAHAALDALIGLQAKHRLSANEITEIEVHLFSRPIQSLNNDRAPANLEAAQYSIPFCVALAAVRGSDALLPIQESSLRDPDVLSLSRKVTLHVDPELDAMFPSAVPSRVVIAHRLGRFSETALEPKGEPGNPMTWEEIVHKLRVLTGRNGNGEAATAMVRAIKALDSGDASALRGVLSRPWS